MPTESSTCAMPLAEQKARASSASCRDTQAGVAVSATTPSPSTSWATASSSVESTPPENATAAFPSERSPP
ncbi:MAG: hypothetical protein LKE37_08500 [Atopobiaceae bacterium]|jgi:hypothetical protein|nr:hypothetical protein [Atopobiaceae bacterium]